MRSSVLDPEVAAGLETIAAGIDKRGLHRHDGHASAKVMVRHTADLSDDEAARRAKTARALTDLPAVADAFRAGDIGRPQTDRIARAHANPRVRERLCEQDQQVADLARDKAYRLFDARLTDWVRLTDEDGTCDRAQRNHENRNAALIQEHDQSWTLRAICGSLQGAEMHDIFKHFIDAEWETDWANARAKHGDAATAAHLARTDAQRRFDALYAIFQRAASALPGGNGARIITNLLLDQDTLERTLHRMTGQRPPAPNIDLYNPTKTSTDTDPDDTDPDDTGTVGFRCSTIDGYPVDPPKPPSQHYSDTSAESSSTPTAPSSTSPDNDASSTAPPASPPNSPRPSATGRAVTSSSPTARSTTSSPGPTTEEVPTPEMGDPPAGDTTGSNRTATAPGETPPAPGTSNDPTAPKSTDPRRPVKTAAALLDATGHDVARPGRSDRCLTHRTAAVRAHATNRTPKSRRRRVTDMSWKDEAKVEEYVSRVGRLEARRAGELELAESLPATVERCLDLGCGDGRLTALVLDAHPEVEEAVLLDNSAPMLELAEGHFRDDDRIAVLEHDLADAIPASDPFDAIVSGFAIHHLSHRRKQSLFAETVRALRPGGVFSNLEVVQCATPELHDEFNERIGRSGGDPEDVLAGVGEQLDWMRDAGLTHVDCYWRWRGFALLVGQGPA